MYTKYVFENQSYEEAIRDLKATLFDIVALEVGKLNELEEKIYNTMSIDRRQELEELSMKQQSCVNDILEKVSTLAKSVELLDSYSKNLKDIENANIQEMITSLRNKGVSDAYSSDIENSKKERDNIAKNMDNQIESMDVYNDLKEVMKEDVATIKNGPGEEVVIGSDEIKERYYGKDDVNNQIVEETDNIISESVVGDTQEEAVNDLTAEIVSEEPKIIGVENVPIQETNDFEDVVSGDVSAVSDEEAEIVSEGPKIVGVENVPIQETNDFGDVVSGDVSVVSDEEAEIVSEEPKIVGAEDVPVQETNDFEAAVSDSVPAFTNEETEVVSEEPVIVQENSNDDIQLTPIEEETVVPIEEVEETIDRQIDLVQENKNLMSKSDASVISKLVFKKKNNDITKAILTSKKQITNLRNSRENQKALLKVRGSLASNPIASRTVDAIDKAIVNEQDIEKQLMDKGLLEQDMATKQRQIETMLEDATILYKEGKIEEAQAMYDKISELNKVLQKSIGVSK